MQSVPTNLGGPGRSFAADLQLRPDFEERANASANHFVIIVIIGDQNG